MGKPILYVLPISPAVRAVLLTAKEIGLDLELVNVDLSKGEHRTPEFLKMNPQHTVPTLNDNGNYIWDSHAISIYLIEKYAKNDALYPKDLYTRAKITQRLHFNSGILFAKLRDIVSKVLFENVSEVSDDLQKAVHEGYGLLETFLKNDPYLVGSTITFADFAVITTTTQLNLFVPIDVAKYPKIQEWINRISTIAYFDEINTVNLAKFDGFIKSRLAEIKAAAKKGMN